MRDTMPGRKRLILHYFLLQIGYWACIGAFTGFQSAIMLDRGFTGSQVGTIISISGFTGIVFQPLLGAWADRHPQIPLKRVFALCIAPALALDLLFYFTRPGYLGTALIFALIGMAEINTFVLIDSMAMQYINAGVDLPYSLGRGLGAFSYAVLCVIVGVQTARWGMQSALLTHAVLLVLVLLCTVGFPTIPASALPERREETHPHSMWQILRSNPAFALMLTGGFFAMVGVMPIDNFLIQMIEERGGDSSQLGLALFLKAASELPAAFLFQLIYRKLGSRRILLIAIVCMLAKPGLILLSGSLTMLLLVQPIQMLGYGLFTPAAAYFANESVAPEDRVQGQSMKSVITAGLGSVVGNFLSGYAVDWGGPEAMLKMGLISGTIGICFAVAAIRLSKKNA